MTESHDGQTDRPPFSRTLNMEMRPAFLDTPYPRDRTAVDYIFVNQTNIEVLMKTKIIDFNLTQPEELPMTEKAFYREDSSVIHMNVKPVRLFPDPFRGAHNKIALCEVYSGDQPAHFNSRHRLTEFLTKNQISKEDPWMGFEQEYFMLEHNGRILGSDVKMRSFNSKVNYGPTAHLERHIADQHLKACLDAGLAIFGTVKETSFGQWEYQIGPVDCLHLADEMIVSRYLLNRVAEMFSVKISFDPVHYADEAKTKLITSGLHLNYSTRETRAENGIESINKLIKRLGDVKNDITFQYYDRNGGSDTKHRLSGATPYTFKDLNTKRQYFRIPVPVQINKCGYFEDRRPSADCDPYTAILGFLKSAYTDELHENT